MQISWNIFWSPKLQNWKSRCTPSSPSSVRFSTSLHSRLSRWEAKPSSSSRRSTLLQPPSSPCRVSPSTTSPWELHTQGKNVLNVAATWSIFYNRFLLEPMLFLLLYSKNYTKWHIISFGYRLHLLFTLYIELLSELVKLWEKIFKDCDAYKAMLSGADLL